MLKKSFYAAAFILILSSGMAFAQPQSPIYTDDIGRDHFLGRGGYSGVRQMQMNEAQANVVNNAVNEYSKKDNEKQITDVIKEKETVPVSTHKSTYTYQKEPMDASNPYGFGNTNIPTSGVNNSKTIYTDDIGRLHFFGRANIVRE